MKHARFEVLMAVLMNITVSLNVMSCNLVAIYQTFLKKLLFLKRFFQSFTK